MLRGLLILSFLGAALPAGAQETGRLQPDFTFKRVVPPGRDHQGPRITVQITEPAPIAAAPEDAPAIAAGGEGWFWGQIPASRGEMSAGARVRAALDLVLGPAAAGQPKPRLQQANEVARRVGRDLLARSVDTKVSPALALAVILVESGGVADAVSPAGAEGLMQLMPATAERFGVTDRRDPAQSIAGGVAYLDWLIEHFEGDVVLALAGYNAGEGAVRSHGGVPPFPETRDYVPKVLLAWTVARGLCQTPPELLSDGCVFISGP